MEQENNTNGHRDYDPQETQEWIDSLDYILQEKGPDRALWLLDQLENKARQTGVAVPLQYTTPYCNTIPPEKEPAKPGDWEMERRIKSLVRWNAMAMVVLANKKDDGIGGHISTYASSATLLEVAFNHFFKGPKAEGGGDHVYFQGHASPGIYARAFLEGRITEKQLENFRREMGEGGGLSSYPHPWLMPDFWQFPTVSMGLGPVMSIYHARFNRYLQNRGIKDTAQNRIWAFLGDGECDEPETLGAITLAARENLDNLTWVINCNLQRLDGPVRGNGKIIQELEAAFRGAGWNVIKVIWGSEWDALLAADTEGLLLKRMMEVVDGQYQKYSVSSGQYVREHFFGAYPETLEIASRLSDEQVQRIRRGGHDPIKMYAAYHAAINHKGQPTVILAKTIKGYGLGEHGEGVNVAHQQKKLQEPALLHFRTRFGISLNDEEALQAKFYKPSEDSPEIKYLRQQRESLGGYLPYRSNKTPKFSAPKLAEFKEFFEGTPKEKTSSTTRSFRDILAKLMNHPDIGKFIVPIIPDEARTFGMEGMFRKYGIYSCLGQLYDPVDAGSLMPYKEAKNGQILEEGISEAGGMSSFISAGTSYSVQGVNMIPFFIFYSMFGFQRIGDLIWAAADSRTKGFLLGATAGRTTLNGEGLQHEDGHSQLLATTVPNLMTYDPAFAYEIAVIIQNGLHRMYEKGEDIFYYLTLQNEDYAMAPMPQGAEEGILKGLYQFKAGPKNKKIKAQLLGSATIINCALEAQTILAERYDVSANVWSATSYKQLRYDAMEVSRWNMLNPTQKPKTPYVTEVLEKEKGPVIAASDYMRLVPDQIAPWVPGGLISLGTDGFGRSESRKNLRRHFEVDAECITLATLHALAQRGEIKREVVAKAIKDLKIDPKKPFSLLV